jgi:hypothetical protein
MYMQMCFLFDMCWLECTKDSMLYLEWDAFVAVMECWTNVMKADTELRAALSEKATALTHLVLNYDPKDALVLCCVLRCLNSGLMWVLDLDPSKLLQPYLQKVFSCIQCLGELRSKVSRNNSYSIMHVRCCLPGC